jgi:hypothetical protein
LFFLADGTVELLNDGKEVLDFVFFCEIETGEPFVKSPAEVEAVFWLTADEIFAHPSAIIRLKESMEEAQFLQKKIQKKGSRLLIGDIFLPEKGKCCRLSE